MSDDKIELITKNRNTLNNLMNNLKTVINEDRKETLNEDTKNEVISILNKSKIKNKELIQYICGWLLPYEVIKDKHITKFNELKELTLINNIRVHAIGNKKEEELRKKRLRKSYAIYLNKNK